MKELIFSASKRDFRIETFPAGGPGGQHQNKTASAVRITHIATGIAGECRETRSQHQNKRIAFQRLAKRLVTHVLGDQRKARWASGTEIIRTYHKPDNRVKDHRTGVMSSYDRVIDDARLEDVLPDPSFFSSPRADRAPADGGGG